MWGGGRKKKEQNGGKKKAKNGTEKKAKDKGSNGSFFFLKKKTKILKSDWRSDLPGFSFYWLFIEYDSFVSIVNLIWFDQLGLGWKHLLTGFYWVFHRFRCVTSASYRVFLVVQGFFFGSTTERKQVYRVFTEFSSKDSVGCWFCFVLSAKSTAKDVEQKKKGISWKKKKREKSGKKRQEKGGWAGDDDEGRPDTFAEQKTIATGRHRRKSRGRQVVRQPDCTEFFYRVFLFFFVFCRARSIIDS